MSLEFNHTGSLDQSPPCYMAPYGSLDRDESTMIQLHLKSLDSRVGINIVPGNITTTVPMTNISIKTIKKNAIFTSKKQPHCRSPFILALTWIQLSKSLWLFRLLTARLQFHWLSTIAESALSGAFRLYLNTLRPWQNGRHFPDDIFKCIFWNENVWISIKISLDVVPTGQMNNITVLVQVMVWHRAGQKPLSELMMVSILTHIFVTRPQWVMVLVKPECCSWEH